MKASTQIDQLEFEHYLESLSFPFHLRGVLALVGGFIINLVIGSSYRWNMINPYITSYYKITTQPYLIISQDSFAAPLSLFFMGLGMRVGIRVG